MYTYDALSDHDFELLIGDLFGVVEGVRYEAFARGADLGEDLRHERDDGASDVVQCKHYLHSSIPQLRSAARAEARKLAILPRPPATYRFVTSRRLTAANKRTLQNDLAPFIRRQRDIWAKDDLDLVLGGHPDVERRHIKLWLPSSPQLTAIINAGPHARGRALVEEIRYALPRWVPGQAFFEAQEILRRDHVCVIAGAPGIGKTTLAKMLLAQAINDGYEPLPISADVEEAWKAFDPSARQAFYYDDFLGRVAMVERLGKNEEDRLLALMRRIASGRTSLFLLTTREYILQQAFQLYEQLSLEGSDGRRFLLQLSHYSRLDRARIFYNHATFSGQLSREARRSLLSGNAYEAIIDHPAYNPRQIEWITGLSGHHLTDADNQHYVSFAVAALNDPARIWRHGFEHQLNDSQRALLLTLASLADKVDHDDLEKAFEGFCVAAQLGTRGRSFEKALEVLDNSFITIAQDHTATEGTRIFVTTMNPSVTDFLESYLASSTADAHAAIRGAVFFEQVHRLARVVRVSATTSSRVAADFVSALERCLASPSSSWYGVYYGQGAAAPTTTRRPVSVEKRVAFLADVRTWQAGFLAERLHRRLDRLYRHWTSVVLARWRRGAGDRSDALGLLRAMQARGESPKDVLDAAKHLFTSQLHYLYPVGYLVAFHKLFPSVFSSFEWQGLRRSYRELAVSELEDNWQNLELSELDNVKVYAAHFGVSISRKALRMARTMVTERISEAESRAYQQVDRDIEPERPSQDAQKAIGALFARLADH